jgi:assimilatory nitrate reductase catalytic subunit
MINNVTIADFDPKSFEPNFKQCAVNIYSEAVPEGIKQKEVKIAGALEHQETSVTLRETKVKEHTTTKL